MEKMIIIRANMANNDTTYTKRGLKYLNFTVCLKIKLLIIRKMISNRMYNTIVVVIFFALCQPILS